eukprot:scaffold7614_cov147-Skeletonema_menzelii.AAC.2
MTMILSLFFSAHQRSKIRTQSVENKSKSSMKLLVSTLVWALALPPGVYAQTTCACPSLGSIALPISPADGVTTIRLPRVSPSDGLCLLTRRNASTGGERATASRSYAGRNWERSPGVFAKTGNGGETIRAIDGNTNCNWKNGSVMQTCTGRTLAPAWWIVDLGAGKQHTITSILVYNRCDGLTGQEKILNSNVEILDDTYNVVATQSIGSELQAVYTFDFGGVQGRFVRVIKTDNGNLNIAEVEVMGTSSTTGSQPTPPPTFPLTPLPTSQPISTTAAPTKTPTLQPSAPPTPLPTSQPSSTPTTAAPTKTPTLQPSAPPTPLPTPVPSSQPINEPSPPSTPLPTSQPGQIVNLALQADAVASQLSTCNGGEAIRAIDGNTNCNWKNGSVMQTCTGRTLAPAWWMVDLGAGKQHTITSILVYNRCDGLTGQEKILNSNVEILDDAYNVVATQSIGSELQAVYTFDFGGVQGRFVRVIKTGNGNLNIAEVEVMGTSSP